MSRQFQRPAGPPTYNLPDTHHYQILEPGGKTSEPMDETGVYTAIQGGEIVPTTRLTDRRDGRVFTAQDHPLFAATLREFGYVVPPRPAAPAATDPPPVKEPNPDRTVIVGVIAMCVLFMLFVGLCSWASQRQEGTYRPIAGNLHRGVELYYDIGGDKISVGRVVGESGGRVTVENQGKTTVVTREEILHSKLYVSTRDPALPDATRP